MPQKKQKLQYYHYQNSGQTLSQETFICSIETLEVKNRNISKSVKHVQG